MTNFITLHNEVESTPFVLGDGAQVMNAINFLLQDHIVWVQKQNLVQTFDIRNNLILQTYTIDSPDQCNFIF